MHYLGKNIDISHREMITNLRRGDRVITAGGIYGRITGLDDTTVTLEIADKVRIKLARNNVAALLKSQSQTPPKNNKSESEKTE